MKSEDMEFELSLEGWEKLSRDTRYFMKMDCMNKII